MINLVFKNDRNVIVFKDRTHSTESLQSGVYTAFDLLFLLGGIHGDALTEVDITIDFFDFIAVDGSGFFYVLG